ncbi:MAG: hypothetical protein AAF497_19115 [Planctomycetota bacterium]
MLAISRCCGPNRGKLWVRYSPNPNMLPIVIRLVLTTVCYLALTSLAMAQLAPKTVKQPPRSTTSVAKRKAPRPPARKTDAARERAENAKPRAASDSRTNGAAKSNVPVTSARLSDIGKLPIASEAFNPLNPYAYTNSTTATPNRTPEATQPAPVRLNPRMTTSLPNGYRATRNSAKSTTGHATSFGSGSSRISAPQARVTLRMPPPPPRRGIGRVGASAGGG